ncbi:hypothetical protein NG798_10015 [Ancylothrix sp. C2]|uniref:hypothetical protein n=1 Tax=Ancylothrix sp. D3o TaxID=2953691 RepID=UPI0021BB123A|nr:hypothetical protein [Ancylothrix sp. D3o]MCT7950120.1 hypothetical protein [Ancylothrix sp. D3o]
MPSLLFMWEDEKMAELRIICEDSEALKRMIEDSLAERLCSLEDGIKRTEERIQYFENKYGMATEEFLSRFEKDELQHRLDRSFDEWIGETLMLKRLREKANKLRGVEFVN